MVYMQFYSEAGQGCWLLIASSDAACAVLMLEWTYSTEKGVRNTSSLGIGKINFVAVKWLYKLISFDILKCISVI